MMLPKAEELRHFEHIRHLLRRCIVSAMFVLFAPVGALADTGETKVVLTPEFCANLLQEYRVIDQGCEGRSPQEAGPPQLDGNSVAANGKLKDDAAGFDLRLETPQPLSDRVLRESHVLFEAGGTALDAKAQGQIAMLGDILNMPLFHGTCVRLIGHSDTSGAPQQNQRISQARAEVVGEALRYHLDDPARVLNPHAKGELEPLDGWASTDPLNRRVAIWLGGCANQK